jgi:hypothetical protein
MCECKWIRITWSLHNKPLSKLGTYILLCCFKIEFYFKEETRIQENLNIFCIKDLTTELFQKIASTLQKNAVSLVFHMCIPCQNIFFGTRMFYPVTLILVFDQQMKNVHQTFNFSMAKYFTQCVFTTSHTMCIHYQSHNVYSLPVTQCVFTTRISFLLYRGIIVLGTFCFFQEIQVPQSFKYYSSSLLCILNFFYIYIKYFSFYLEILNPWYVSYLICTNPICSFSLIKH